MSECSPKCPNEDRVSHLERRIDFLAEQFKLLFDRLSPAGSIAKKVPDQGGPASIFASQAKAASELRRLRELAAEQKRLIDEGADEEVAKAGSWLQKRTSRPKKDATKDDLHKEYMSETKTQITFRDWEVVWRQFANPEFKKRHLSK